MSWNRLHNWQTKIFSLLKIGYQYQPRNSKGSNLINWCNHSELHDEWESPNIKIVLKSFLGKSCCFCSNGLFKAVTEKYFYWNPYFIMISLIDLFVFELYMDKIELLKLFCPVVACTMMVDANQGSWEEGRIIITDICNILSDNFLLKLKVI